MTQELSTTSVLALFETNKEQRKAFVQDILTRVENGDVDTLKIQSYIKSMEDIVKQINADERYKKQLVEDAQRYGAKSFEAFNAKFEIKEVGVKYDYSQCEDLCLNNLLAQQAELDEKIKQRQKILQAAPQSGLIVTDPETGETFTVYPPAKSSTTSVAVTLK